MSSNAIINPVVQLSASRSALLSSQSQSARAWSTPVVPASFAGHFFSSATATTIYAANNFHHYYRIEREIGAFANQRIIWSLTDPHVYSFDTGLLVHTGATSVGQDQLSVAAVPPGGGTPTESWLLARGRWRCSFTVYVNPLCLNRDAVPVAGVDYQFDLLVSARRVKGAGRNRSPLWTGRVVAGTSSSGNFDIDLRAVALWEPSVTIAYDETPIPNNTLIYEVTIDGARLTSP